MGAILRTPADGREQSRTAMKDQYAGDVNDFWKYAIIRALGSAWPGRLRVCWMLTAPDERADGRHLTYLEEPLRFRAVDPELFDQLGSLIASGQRSVRAVESMRLWSEACFHSTVLNDALSERTAYFEDLWASTTAEDLLFFDPDNGVEVPSVPKGRRESSRYVYWDELDSALQKAGAICIYQHFPHVPREPFISNLLLRARERAPGRQAFAVSSTRVTYVVVSKDERGKRLSCEARRLVERSRDLRLLAA
jgi:hypothetical protein